MGLFVLIYKSSNWQTGLDKLRYFISQKLLGDMCSMRLLAALTLEEKLLERFFGEFYRYHYVTLTA